jgi:hypothetical protein
MTLDPKRLEEIYDRLPELVLELDPDPAGRGTAYLQDLISQTRGMLNEVGVYLQEILREKGLLESDLEMLTASFEIGSNELLANDDRVSRLPAVQDRLAMINVILCDEYRVILDRKREVNDATYAEKAVRHRHRELEQTMSAIRLQRSLLQTDMRTGAYNGDENSQGRGDSWRGDASDDIESDDIDRLLAETEAEQVAEAAKVVPISPEVVLPEPEKKEPLGKDQLNDLLGGYDDDVCPEDEPLLCCSECGEPLVEGTSGVTCKNGHGGKAPELPAPAEPEPPKASKAKASKAKASKAKVEPEDPDVASFLDDEDDFADIFDALDEKDDKA